MMLIVGLGMLLLATPLPGVSADTTTPNPQPNSSPPTSKPVQTSTLPAATNTSASTTTTSTISSTTSIPSTNSTTTVSTSAPKTSGSTTAASSSPSTVAVTGPFPGDVGSISFIWDSIGKPVRNLHSSVVAFFIEHIKPQPHSLDSGLKRVRREADKTTPAPTTTPNPTTTNTPISPGPTTTQPSTASPSPTATKPTSSPAKETNKSTAGSTSETSGNTSTASPHSTPTASTASPDKETSSSALPTNTSIPTQETSPDVTDTTSDVTDSSTVAPVTTSTTPVKTPTTPVKTPTTPAPERGVLISETNILLTNTSLFVELHGIADAIIDNLTLIIFDADNSDVSSSILWRKTFTNSTHIDNNGYYLQPVNQSKVPDSVTAVLVALYRDQFNQSQLSTNLQDFAVVSNHSKLASNVHEALLNEQSPIITSTAFSNNLTLSRCGGLTPFSCDQYVISASTPGKANQCGSVGSVVNLTLGIKMDGVVCSLNTSTVPPDTDESLQRQVLQALGLPCQCGLSPRSLTGKVSCGQKVRSSLFLDFQFVPTYKGQAAAFTKAFVQYVSGQPGITVGKASYKVYNCTLAAACRALYSHHVPNKPDDDNSKMTVAVVLSCIAVFVVTLMAVICYMRRKRRGIMRQFRMTRLQEDDDMDDMEDFVGGGYNQEPSFNSNRSR